jgi:ribonuclease HI
LEIKTDMEKIDLYTDGGCSGNPGPGAWAFVICNTGCDIRSSGGETLTTNNRMELLAVINALAAVKRESSLAGKHIEIHTDSEYVKRGITEWIKNWEKNGFRTSSKTPVKNQDLWLNLKSNTNGLDLSWKWVKGHAGNEKNEECDRMVQEEIARLKRKV